MIVQICKDISELEYGLNKALEYLQAETEIDDERVGSLLPLGCGHSGIFNPVERVQYENHLRNAKFIN